MFRKRNKKSILVPPGSDSAIVEPMQISTLLLVDDDPALLRLMRAGLSGAQLRVEATASASDAREALKKQPYSALLTDALSGYETLIGDFRKRNPYAPIMVLTGGLSSEEEARAKELGANLVLYKPIGVAAVKANLMDLIGAAAADLKRPPQAVPDATLEEVKGLERRLIAASLKMDVIELKELLADSYVFAAGTAEQETKQQRLTSLTSGDLRYQSAEIRTMSASHYGQVCVVTTQLWIAGTRQGRDISGEYRSVRVYTRKPQRWQAVSGQLTRIWKLTEAG